MKVQIVAEIGSNWDPGAPLESCEALIDAVAEAGADFAKFQDWHPLKRFNRPDWWKEKSGRWTLDPGVLTKLRAHAQGRGVGFVTSAFTPQAVERAQYHSIVKIASSEIGNQDLLLRVGRSAGKLEQVWLSLGEVENVFQVSTAISRLARHRLCLLACVAEYPVCRPLDLWDSFTFAQQFGAVDLGVSSHIAYPHCRAMIQQLVQRGAGVVEVHVRLRGVTPDDAPDNGPWSLWIEEFADLVRMIRRMDTGQAREPAKEEWD